MSAKTDAALVAIIRQEFLAGASLRQLSEKHGVALRTLAEYSKREGWDSQRDLQRSASALPVLARAADARAKAVNADWKKRLSGVVDQLLNIAERASDALAETDMRACDLRELVGTLKVAVDSLGRIQDMVKPAGAATTPVLPSVAEAKAILERRGPRLSPEDRRREILEMTSANKPLV